MSEMDEVLEFWFPADAGRDFETHKAYWDWRMRGGADDEIVRRFSQLTERAARGELDHWANTPRGRLALIVVLATFLLVSKTTTQYSTQATRLLVQASSNRASTTRTQLR